ncbi:hypothetical protein BDQ17DRAFT_1390008 [Cyathus striatus]|nr:hypothetical protein BDQ17DRAFT_1390008 [Cyathus striatus]
MQDPKREIASVVQQLTATSSPDVQKAAIERYMTPDVAFRHPVCQVNSGPKSREELLGIYQWYRVLSPHIDIRVESVVFDEEKNLLFLEGVQWFKMFFLPNMIAPSPSHLIIRLTLRKENNLYYIAKQEDFYHTDEFAALLLPPAVPLVRLGLGLATIVSNILARSAQVIGIWRPKGIPKAPESDAGTEDLYNFDKAN